MKRHLAILAFGVLVAGSVTYAQITPQGASHSASTSVAQSASATTAGTKSPAAPVSGLAIAKPSIAGGEEND